MLSGPRQAVKLPPPTPHPEGVSCDVKEEGPFCPLDGTPKHMPAASGLTSSPPDARCPTMGLESPPGQDPPSVNSLHLSTVTQRAPLPSSSAVLEEQLQVPGPKVLLVSACSWQATAVPLLTMLMAAVAALAAVLHTFMVALAVFGAKLVCELQSLEGAEISCFRRSGLPRGSGPVANGRELHVGSSFSHSVAAPPACAAKSFASHDTSVEQLSPRSLACWSCSLAPSLWG